MAELVWDGKGRARPAGRAALVVGEVHGDVAPAGHDRLVRGPAERVLAGLLPELAGKVALVYVDPPFETGQQFDYRTAIPGAPDGSPRASVPAYDDARGLDAWLGWFHEIASRLAELLADGGSLYVHLDAHVAHYAKVLLDEVLGPTAFQREIIWRIGWISGFKSRARGWIRNHDTILFYAKGGRPSTFHKEYLPYPEGYVRRDGVAPTGRGFPLDDVWNATEADRLDSIQIKSFSGEKVGYPTQKNEALVARIVSASSSPGDVVLDCCVGSGTTAVVASRLGRRWIACDASPVAIHATRRRLLALPRAPSFTVESDGPLPDEGRDLGVRTAVDGKRCSVELTSLTLPPGGGASVEHWSQWVDGWCVDWENDGGALRAGSTLWRNRKGELPLSTEHVYAGPGARLALVRTYDLLGGMATRSLPVVIDAR